MKNDERNDPVFMDEKNAMRDNVKKARKEGLLFCAKDTQN